MTRLKRFILVFIIFFGGSFMLTGVLNTCLFIGIWAGLMSLAFPTKKEKIKRAAELKAKEEAHKREKEARKRNQEAKERAKKAPGCHSMDNVDILTFRSSNNLLTAGNNSITMKIRNRNPYDVIVTISFKYSDSEGFENSTKSFEVGGNKIRTIDTLGAAWHKAKDVTIVAVH